ncbi:unnamed protein product [Moneuplotes crassus]|uniref:Uncharacterized protein n=1 Tax=Euplotes crassus TaxID=5936 RepID=A0AAD2CVH4_EUPCR|nr:unnamed protein product [Moneuplotes crassus]
MEICNTFVKSTKKVDRKSEYYIQKGRELLVDEKNLQGWIFRNWDLETPFPEDLRNRFVITSYFKFVKKIRFCPPQNIVTSDLKSMNLIKADIQYSHDCSWIKKGPNSSDTSRDLIFWKQCKNVHCGNSRFRVSITNKFYKNVLFKTLSMSLNFFDVVNFKLGPRDISKILITGRHLDCLHFSRCTLPVQEFPKNPPPSLSSHICSVWFADCRSGVTGLEEEYYEVACGVVQQVLKGCEWMGDVAFTIKNTPKFSILKQILTNINDTPTPTRIPMRIYIEQNYQWSTVYASPREDKVKD